MSGGSKKPKPTPVSEGEKISAQLAKDQIAYYRSTFAPLESEFRDVASRDYSDRFAGQAGTASMRELTPALAGAAASPYMMDTGDVAEGVSMGRVGGMAQGRAERDAGRLESLKVGLGITADATASLADAGRIQTNAAIDLTREKLAKQQAKADLRNAALGAIAAVGGAYGTKKYMDTQSAKQATQDKANLTAAAQQRAIQSGTAYEHPLLRRPLMGR